MGKMCYLEKKKTECNYDGDTQNVEKNLFVYSENTLVLPWTTYYFIKHTDGANANFKMEDNKPFLALSCSKDFFNDQWQQNIRYYNYITKSFKTHSVQAFSQLKGCIYADICIYIVCM